MKRTYFWLIIIALLLITIGNREYSEVSDRAIVNAVGIDSSDEGITVTLQVFNPQGTGGDTQIDPSKSNVFVISDTADSFEEALDECESQLGNYLFMGHNQVIVLGSGVSFEDPSELFSYFIQNRENYLGVDVVLAENTAKEIMKVQLTKGAVATENFTEIIKMYRENGEAVYSDMLHLVNALNGGDRSAVIPLVSVRKDSTDSHRQGAGEESESSSQEESSSQSESGSGEEDSKSDGSQGELIVIDGAAVIHDGKVTGTLSQREITGLNWMTKKIDQIVVNTEVNGSPTGVTVKNKDTDVSMLVRENRLVLKTDIKAEILPENSMSAALDGDELNKAVETEIKTLCSEAVEKIYGEYDSDVFNAVGNVKFHYPQVYLDFKDDIEGLKDLIDFEINVECIAK
ncbi:MAG: Ger(x)C family spore germination C-terminal domain-containing protein [Oscillospiraceae bacterium]